TLPGVRLGHLCRRSGGTRSERGRWRRVGLGGPRRAGWGGRFGVRPVPSRAAVGVVPVSRCVAAGSLGAYLRGAVAAEGEAGGAEPGGGSGAPPTCCGAQA